MKWLVGQNDLDKEQRKYLEGGRNDDGSYTKSFMDRQLQEYILGFPGSGKTILMLYSVGAQLYEKPDSKILIIEFTHALIKMLEAALKELVYNGRKIDTSNIKVVTYYDFDRNYAGQHFDLILCDEVQDVPTDVLNNMKSRATRVVLAGDHNQSIYKQDPKWDKTPCSIADIERTFAPNKTSLYILHRLGKPIARAIQAFMPSMNILNGRIPMVRDNIQVSLWKGSSQNQEASYIYKDALETINVAKETVGILFPTHNKIVKFVNRILANERKPLFNDDKTGRERTNLEGLNEHLAQNGIKMQYVANGYGDFIDNKDLVVITTYHSAKGLDFDKVFLPFCNHTDEYSVYNEDKERIFMVAMTRSRKDLIISYTGSLDHYVDKFKDQCNYRVLGQEGPGLFDDEDKPKNKKDDELFDF